MLRPTLLITVALTLFAAAAGAASPPNITARLDYTVPPGCPPASTLSAEFARRIGYEPFVKDSPLLVVARITRKKGMLAGSIDVYDAAGTLLWTTSATPAWHCDAMVVEMASALAFRFDPHVYPSWLPGEAPPAPAPAPAPTPPSPPPPVAAPPPADAPSVPPRRWQARVGLGSVVGFGIAPRTAVGLTTDVGVLWPLPPFDGFSLTLGAIRDPPAGGDALSAGAKVSSSVLVATAAPCIHQWKLYGCGVVGVGFIWGDASDSYDRAHVAGMYAPVGLRLGVEVPFASHLGLRVYGEFLTTIVPVDLELNGRPAWMTPPASGGVGVGLYAFD